MITLMIPGEPTGKGRPKFSSRGAFVKVYTPEKTAKYENWVKCCFLDKYSQYKFKPFDGDTQLKMKVVCFFGVPQSISKKKKQEMLTGKIRPTKKPDLDNVLKIIADSLNGLAYSDDKQIVSTVVDKYYSEEPRVAVIVEEVE